ncbi:hypothetical protein [Amycolatopsis sp. NPDC004079]|uniref:hypothetical protein n=1 Tax=Amycolatopsis sp. NPDC004079 TaxID=3154549 RepID=UPI0033B7FFDD
MLIWVTAGAFFLARRLWHTKIVNKHQNIGKYGWFVPVLFLIVGAWTLLIAPLPWGLGSPTEVLGGILKWAIGILIGFFGGGSHVVSVVATVALIGLAIGAIADLWDHIPDRTANTAIWALPVLAAISVTPIASALLAKIHLVQGWATHLISSIG